jgi:beta-glucosidase
MHFTLPTWIAAQGGWESPATIEDFGRFAAFCAREFGSEIDDWITVNEPNIYGFKAYEEGEWPPGKQDRMTAIRVMANELVGHGRAARALRREDRAVASGPGQSAPCRIGLANHVVVVDPWNALSPIDQARSYFEDQVFNLAGLEAVRSGRYVATMPGTGQVEVSDPDLAGSVDFIGINYYTRRLVSGMTETRKPDLAPRNDLDWEIYPDGLYRWLDRLRSQQLPVYITENGTADNADRFRDRFIVQHLMRVWAAADAGIAVKGYFHWSLMDNFEWAEGFAPRFGLYRVDYERDNTSRTLTRGGEVFKTIATANRIPADLVRRLGQEWTR